MSILSGMKLMVHTINLLNITVLIVMLGIFHAPITSISAQSPTQTESAPPSTVISAENIGQITPIKRLGQGHVIANFWLRSGQEFGVVTSQEVKIYTLVNERLQVRLTLDYSAGYILASDYHPATSQLVTLYSNGEGVVWNTNDGSLVQSYKLESGLLGQVVFNETGNTVYLVGSSLVGQWLLERNTLEIFTSEDQPLYPTRIDMINDYILIVYDVNRQIILWDVQTQTTIFKTDKGIDFFTWSAQFFAYKPKFNSPEIQIIDVNTGQALATLHHDNASLGGLAFSPDEQQLIVGGGDGYLARWDTATWSLLDAYTPNNTSRGYIYQSEFDADSTHLVTLTYDGILQYWEVASGLNLVESYPISPEIKSFHLNPEGSSILFQGRYDHIELISVPQMEYVASIDTARYKLNDTQSFLAWANETTTENQILFSDKSALDFEASIFLVNNWYRTDNSLYILELQSQPSFGQIEPQSVLTMNLVKVEKTGGQIVNEIITDFEATYPFVTAFSPAGEWLVVGGADGQYQMYHIPSHTYQQTALIPSAIVALDISADNTMLAISYQSGQIDVVDMTTNQVLHQFEATTSQQFIGFNQQISVLATGTSSGVISLWSFDGTLLQQFNQNGLRALAFHPTYPLLATATEDSAIQFWDTQTGALVYALQSMKLNEVHKLNWASDGTWLATNSLFDFTIQVWGIADKDS